MKYSLGLVVLFLVGCSEGDSISISSHYKGSLKPGLCLKGDMNPGTVIKVEHTIQNANGLQIGYEFVDDDQLSVNVRDESSFRARYDQLVGCEIFEKMKRAYKDKSTQQQINVLFESVQELRARLDKLERKK
jgi:hypothetical protein